MNRSPAAQAFFDRFRAARGVAHDQYVVVTLGDEEMSDALVALVERGTKRATASLLRDYQVGSEPLPRVGDFVVVVDLAARPRLIWRTTEVVVKPFVEVDDAFAWDEGEGDRTRAGWLEGHRSFFERCAAREGFQFDERTPTVFERFVVTWPPGIADEP